MIMYEKIDSNSSKEVVQKNWHSITSKFSYAISSGLPQIVTASNPSGSPAAGPPAGVPDLNNIKIVTP